MIHHSTLAHAAIAKNQCITCLLYTSLAGDDTPSKIAIYDLDGNQQLLLGGDQHGDSAYFGSLTGIAETANGYIAADGNMREFYFWSKDGTLLAEVDCYDMFGTRYPVSYTHLDVYKRQLVFLKIFHYFGSYPSFWNCYYVAG